MASGRRRGRFPEREREIVAKWRGTLVISALATRSESRDERSGTRNSSLRAAPRGDIVLAMELDRTEARILGALIEKRWTTPDAYPLSLNALLAACNQKSNRDPVMQLQEFEISGCLMGLRQKGLLMLHDREGGRVQRYGEKLMDELHVSRQEIAILAELLLRGPQTAGELTRRCARMAPMGGQSDVEQLLRDLAGGRFVHLLPKASGQRYARWQQLLCSSRTADADDGDDDGNADAPAEPTTFVQSHAPQPVVDAGGPVMGAGMPAAAPADVDVREEIEALRKEVIALRQRVADLEALIAD